MSTQQNVAVARRTLEECFNKGNFAVIPEVIAPNYVNHTDNLHGPEDFRRFVTMYRTAFPDLKLTIENLVAERDIVVIRWTARGTHRGELMGIPPTGKSAMVTGMVMIRFADGKAVEEWANYDRMGMMQQLGVIPAPAHAMH